MNLGMLYISMRLDLGPVRKKNEILSNKPEIKENIFPLLFGK